MFALADVREIDDERARRPRPFVVHSLGELEGKQIPERDWLVPSVLIRRSITLFAGDGGVGKSLMTMQLQVAAALGRDWMGIPIGRKIPSFGFYCEDDKDELDRRFLRICQHYGTTFSEVGDLVRYTSRVGEPDNELVTFRGKMEFSKPVRTPTYDQVEEEIKDYGTELVILDTASDIFAGNENIRFQVKSFVTSIRRLAIINNGGVILNSHPSKSAMQDGSGFSGSTAWNGSVRNRLYLSTPKKKGDEDDDGPTDERVLKIMKSNYGKFGEKIRCKWDDGVFVQVSNAPGSMIDRLETDARILKATEYVIGNGGRIAANTSAKNSLAATIRNLPSCRDLQFHAVCNAQDRMIADGRLVKVAVGPASKEQVVLRPPHLRYSGEHQ